MTATAAMTTPALAAEDLPVLLAQFNETAARLQSTHDALQRQVGQLQAELADAKEKLRRSEALAALGEMAAGIAHEIRNPLGSIRLYTQLLQDDLGRNTEHASLCSKIDRGVHRLEAIVGDVLAFAREREVRSESIDIPHLVHESIRECHGLAVGAGVRIEFISRDDRVCTLGDPGLLRQALGNVLRNAIEATRVASPPDPRVSVTVTQVGRRQADGRRRPHLSIGVEDNGDGIPDDVRRRMFNPFFTTRSEGTGLGLAIVHRIVDAHGGEVDVANRPGGGALVVISLPIVNDNGIRSQTIEGSDIE